MPELPEVETIVRQLARALPGERIVGVRVLKPDLLREPPAAFRQQMRGREILAVKRRGKNVVLELSGPRYLLVNLGMTGGLAISTRKRNPEDDEAEPAHLAVTIQLASGRDLRYTDIRRFGHLLLFTRESWRRESARLGPEPLGRNLTPEKLHQALSASRAPIRSWLLDQRRIAGIGNIYAAEALFRAGIHPARPAGTLTSEESKALLEGIRSVLREAIRAQGTTLRDYRTATGERGDFGRALQVYGREGEPCPVCKALVTRSVFGNRSAFFCPECQPVIP